MSEWLYQIRIKVTENISEDLRSEAKAKSFKKNKKDCRYIQHDTCLHI